MVKPGLGKSRMVNALMEVIGGIARTEIDSTEVNEVGVEAVLDAETL